MRKAVEHTEGKGGVPEYLEDKNVSIASSGAASLMSATRCVVGWVVVVSEQRAMSRSAPE